MKNVKKSIYNLLVRTGAVKSYIAKMANPSFRDSATYWENRYRKNGNSGDGSYGIKAAYKGSVINQFVTRKNVLSIIELGCGDGNQLKQFKFKKYTGFDVSPTAVAKCEDIFKDDASKNFLRYDPEIIAKDFTAELTLSLDVIYHLIEDDVFEKYMNDLFSMSLKYVIIYAWNVEEAARYHVRHRKFNVWIENNIPGFQLIESIRKEGFCDFFIYEKK